MQRFVNFAVLFVLLITVGCATIISGTKQSIGVNSSPTNAEVVIMTKGGIKVFSGRTPASAPLQRMNEYMVTVSMSGYQDQTIWITHSFNGWVIGNLICGGVLGLVVDAVSGSIWNLEPDSIIVTLVVAMRDGRPTHYAVLGMLDDQGQLRTLAVPMIPTQG